MNWYYEIRGDHTHVKVFMNGGKCGDLCFRNDEFEQVKEHCPWIAFSQGAALNQRKLQQLIDNPTAP